jgi:CheY-like chemotaxis protein
VGTGLGLAICLGLTRGMGGDIELESVEGEGSIFRVVLPCGDHACATPDTRSFGTIPVARARLLLVDDDSLMLSSLRKLLREHDVQTAWSAREALAKLEQGARYDLIVCDVMMPEMTGVDFLEAVRARWPALERHVVLMTGGAVTADTQQFLAHTSRVLEKPFTREAVRDCLTGVREGMPP